MKRFLAAAVFLLLTAGSGFAQGITFGPQVGFIKSADADKSSIMPGAALRVSLLGWGIEGSIYYKSEDITSGNVNIKTKSYPINITAMMKILPFIHGEAGLGWYDTQIDFSRPIASITSETKSSAGYHFGAGAEIPMGNIVLTGDVRYVFLNLSSVASFKSNFYVIMVGAMFKVL